MGKNWKKFMSFFQEAVVLSAFLSYIILVLQDLNGILGRVTDGTSDLSLLLNPVIWAHFGISSVRYFVLFLIGLFTRIYKKMTGAEIEKLKAENESKDTANIHMARAFLQLENAAVQAGDAELIKAAQSYSHELIDKGVNMYLILDNALQKQLNEIREKQDKLSEAEPDAAFIEQMNADNQQKIESGEIDPDEPVEFPPELP
jgi:hypothetical protein